MILENLGGWMKGQDCVIVGCGPSADRPDAAFIYRENWTLSCNRSIEYCLPDFAVCVEPFHDEEVWRITTDAAPLIVFTHLNKTKTGRKAHARQVQFSSKDVRLWLVPGTEFDRDKRVRLGQCPFFAAAVAIHLGFRTIGLIGVDYTEDRFPDVEPSNEGWRRLNILAVGLGSRIVNLNPESRLSTASVPKEPWSSIRPKT